MKFIFTIIILGFSLIVFGQDNYILSIDDKELEVTLDKEYEIMINNELVKLRLKSKDTLHHDDILFHFKYPNDYKVSRMSIEEGIDQVTIMTAGGSGILIQQYTTFNPTMLTAMMMNEVTKESINYGFTKESENYQLELTSGQKINVERVVLTYKDEINIYEISSVGEKDEGILIMTMRMDDMNDIEGQKIIDLMWSTLNYK